jgi:hypothetical protein
MRKGASFRGRCLAPFSVTPLLCYNSMNPPLARIVVRKDVMTFHHLTRLNYEHLGKLNKFFCRDRICL